MSIEENATANSITDKHEELDKLVNDFYNAMTEDFLEFKSEYRESVNDLLDNQSELFNKVNDLESIEEERRTKKALIKEYFKLTIGLLIIAFAAVGIVSLTTHFMGW